MVDADKIIHCYRKPHPTVYHYHTPQCGKEQKHSGQTYIVQTVKNKILFTYLVKPLLHNVLQTNDIYYLQLCNKDIYYIYIAEVYIYAGIVGNFVTSTIYMFY